MNPMTIEILVLAGIALFLVLRLRNVLGTREGFEKPETNVSTTKRSPDLQVIDGGPDADIIDHVDPDSSMAEKLATIKRIDPGFSVAEFLGGARSAYEMILMSFERGNIEETRAYLSDDVAGTFDMVIKERQSRGINIEAEFAGIRETKLNEVGFDTSTNVADLTVLFLGELISVVKNVDGDIVEGDGKQVKRQKDVWTFSKDMSSDDPNWRLVATDE
ncbi:MAG: Tim44/TimA family putative adaptor protein [Paracoccaceae bacterium]|nr:Tim44/TimA family putative adaptor protein [Paracoccaceae bacterium]